jgi:hypothetical protein
MACTAEDHLLTPFRKCPVPFTESGTLQAGWYPDLLRRLSRVNPQAPP